VRGLECEALAWRAVRRRFELRADDRDILSEDTAGEDRRHVYVDCCGGG
jgi:hypothetical protein